MVPLPDPLDAAVLVLLLLLLLLLLPQAASNSAASSDAGIHTCFRIFRLLLDSNRG